jgi:hypothetical protein
MSDEMQIEGKSYISSKRAAELTGYAQDYIGQLARKGLIEARRIGGLWYVSMDSLQNYKKKADEFKPEPPARVDTQEPGTLIFFDGKEYLSAARAAEQTGYTQDYVGQLARAGTILSRQVGNRWYVARESILSHKAEKDRLLAIVQTESVGLTKKPVEKPIARKTNGHEASTQLLNYFSESADLMPAIESRNSVEIDKNEAISVSRDSFSAQGRSEKVAIRRLRATQSVTKAVAKEQPKVEKRLLLPRGAFSPLLLGAAATIIIVLSVGYLSILKQNSMYAVNLGQNGGTASLAASVDSAFSSMGDFLEPFLTHERVYQRPDSQ